MHKINFYFACLIVLFFSHAYSTEINGETPDPGAIIKGIIKNIFQDNDSYIKTRPATIESQTPRATILTCSDSRVQTTGLDQTPENDLFLIRNIGNQLVTSLGSVEYGVRKLHTPVLFIIGHTGCGAIKGALEDYSSLPEESIKKELSTLILPENMKKLKQEFIESVKAEEEPEKVPHESKKEAQYLGKESAARIRKGSVEAVENECSVENVHEQVRKAREDTFKDYFAANKPQEKNLLIIGLICDVLNVYRQGAGRLYVVNIDGEKNPDEIIKRPEFNNIKYFILPRPSKQH